MPAYLEPAARALRPLRRADLPADTVTLARHLIGRLVVREFDGERLVGRIVETEAYPVGDPAGHAFIGPTRRNGSLFLERGRAYVYLCYGTSYMLNVSSEEDGIGAGVLVRALEPLAGLARMRRLRATERALDLARGPGRLTEALGIDLCQDGLDLCARGALFLAEGARAGALATSVRIGLTRAVERRLRFFERGNPYVSGPRRLGSRA